MRPVSAQFLTTLRGSHGMNARAFVVAAGQSGTAPTGTEIPIFGGDVRLDANAAIRSTLDLSTDGTDAFPRAAADLLAPYGNEVYVERGVSLGAHVEWVSLGYHRIDTPQQGDVPVGPIRLTAKDRMAGLIDGRLLAPVQYGPTVTYGTIMTELVTQVYPAATIEWDDATDTMTIGRALIAEEDRHKFLAELVQSVAKIWYWDHRGVLVVRDPPDPTAPVFDVNSGAGGVLVALTRQLTREGVYNAVVASGEAADTQAPVRGVAVDANPNSPTYFYGPFGPVPRFYTSPFLLTDEQARAAAEALLRQNLGLAYNVDFTAIPNPALEPWDAVRVRQPDRPAEIHIVETLVVPLVATAAMTGGTREQTTVLIGEGPG